MSTLSPSNKRSKCVRHIGVGEILTSSVWLLISVSVYLPLEVHSGGADVLALLLLSKDNLPEISKLIFKIRVPTSLRYPAFTWRSEALLWEILSAVSSDYFAITGSFALYSCMKYLFLEPTWTPTKVVLASTSCFVSVPADKRHPQHQFANAFHRFMGHVHQSLDAIGAALQWKCQIDEVLMTVPASGITYKVRRNKLLAFAAWTEKEETSFLNKETDDYYIYLEEDDRQPPLPFDMWYSFDCSSYVKVNVPLPWDVQEGGIKMLSFQWRPTMSVPKKFLNVPKPIVKILNAGAYQMVSPIAGARTIFHRSNLNILQLYCRLKELDDNTRALVFKLSSKTLKAIKTGTMTVNERRDTVPFWTLRQRIKKFRARGFIFLQENLNMNYYDLNLDPESSSDTVSSE